MSGKQDNNRYAALDGLRAVSAIMVYGVHFGGPAWAPYSGWLGVQAFFVLSGFLITGMLLQEREASGTVAMGAFYLRRAARILPAYSVVLCIVVLQAYIYEPFWPAVREALPFFLTFTNEFAPPTNFMPSWTLGIEWKFYLVWPLVFLLPLSWRGLAVAWALAVAVFVINWNVRIFQASHYSVLLIGAGLAIAMQHEGLRRRLEHLSSPLASVALLAGVVAFHVWSLDLKALLGDGRMNIVYGALIAGLLVALLGNNPVQQLFGSAPLAAIGRRSYSFYLVQIIALQAFNGVILGVPPSTGGLVGAVVVGLMLADIMYRYVELPAISAARALLVRPKRKAAQPA
ncbi:acyltransferase family protein [Ancylobacter radicis]|uniref:Acyltransferase n=1 Tax=Ancylobacter radicis TaxID=2836179 RepID=A0ABS5R625_9HYPH|nr:acyltransferase [Ancylobacter radicis]MBS9476249.1 acyltransferase [Ancylobacter radicis]